MVWGLTSYELQVIFWVAVNCITGWSIITLNAHILHEGGFPFPIAFSCFGVLGGALISHSAVFFGLIKISCDLNRDDMIKRIIPISLMFALCLSGGNSVYMYLSVSFAQMLKALTPVYILLIMAFFGLKQPGASSILSVIVISVGTAIASFGELKFSVVGFALATFADIIEGTRLVMLQLLMADKKLSAFETLYYMFPFVAGFQFVLVALFERELLGSQSHLVGEKRWFILLTAVLGFGINLSGSKILQLTSGLTFKLVNVMRNNFLVVLSILFLGDKTTVMQVVGYITSITGFAWYTKIEHELANAGYVKVDSKV